MRREIRVVRNLREELQLLQEPGSYVGDVIKHMGNNKVLVKVPCRLSLSVSESLTHARARLVQVHPEGKYVVDLDKNIDSTKISTGTRVALRNDSYVLHKILPNKVDPLVSLMRVEKVPDSTYEVVGGLDKQIKEIKEVCALAATTTTTTSSTLEHDCDHLAVSSAHKDSNNTHADGLDPSVRVRARASNHCSTGDRASNQTS